MVISMPCKFSIQAEIKLDLAKFIFHECRFHDTDKSIFHALDKTMDVRLKGNRFIQHADKSAPNDRPCTILTRI